MNFFGFREPVPIQDLTPKMSRQSLLDCESVGGAHHVDERCGRQFG